MIRALFYRGRHHLHAPLLARPFDERPRVTVAAVAERIRREAREAAVGRAAIVIRADVEGLSSKLRAALDQHRAQMAAPAVEIGRPA